MPNYIMYIKQDTELNSRNLTKNGAFSLLLASPFRYFTQSELTVCCSSHYTTSNDGIYPTPKSAYRYTLAFNLPLRELDNILRQLNQRAENSQSVESFFVQRLRKDQLLDKLESTLAFLQVDKEQDGRWEFIERACQMLLEQPAEGFFCSLL